MADFDAILRKALASRPNAPGEERRKIYERARQALIRQLTGFEPPLPPEDISRQRLALESAIRKVEADVAANGGVLPTPVAQPPAPARTVAPEQPAPQSATPPAVTPPPQPSATPPEMPSSSAGSIAPPLPVDQQPSAASEPPALTPPSREPVLPATDAVPPSLGMASGSRERSAEPQTVRDPLPGDLPDFEPERSQAQAPEKRGNRGLIAALVAIVVLAGGGVAAWQTGMLDSMLAGQSGEQQAADGEEVLEEAPVVRTIGETDPTRASERLLPDNQGAVESEPVELTPPSDAPENGGEDVANETPVDLEPADTTETAALEPTPEQTPNALPVAQSAILYEEGLTPDADGFTAPGRTVWRLDDGDQGPVIVGSVEVPARGIALDIRISRNLDDALPATHLIEFSFQLSEAFPAEGVAELVGVVVKPEEQSGGDPLRGAIVDLGQGVFWQALASGEADQAVNLPLIRDGAWFDLPVLYADNRRAIITFEKGSDGEDVFAQALAAWSN